MAKSTSVALIPDTESWRWYSKDGGVSQAFCSASKQQQQKSLRVLVTCMGMHVLVRVDGVDYGGGRERSFSAQISKHSAVKGTVQGREKGEYQALKLSMLSFQLHEPFSGRAFFTSHSSVPAEARTTPGYESDKKGESNLVWISSSDWMTAFPFNRFQS